MCIRDRNAAAAEAAALKEAELVEAGEGDDDEGDVIIDLQEGDVDLRD